MGDSGPSDSQAGDDPAYEGDEGVGYGNVNTTTQQFQDDNQSNVSNISNSSTYDAQFTADNLESRGLNPSNFMSSDNYSQTTQAARESGFDTPSVDTSSINVPTIQAAGTSPTFSGVGVSDVFDPMTMQSPSNTMIEALGAAPTAPEAKGTPSYTAFGDPTMVQSFLPAEVDVRQIAPQTQQQLGLAALAQTLNQARDKGMGMGDPRGIDFGVTAPVASTVGDDFGPALDMVDARTQAANQPSIVGDDFGPALDMVDSRTTATGAEDPFDPDVGRPFDAKRMADIEAIYGKFDPKTGSYPTTSPPGVLGLVEDRTKDALATSIALGRNLNPIEAIFGYTAPNMAKDKETIEEYNARTGASIPDSQLIRNDSGVVIGIKDAMGNLVTGNDPSARANDQGSDTEQKKAKPKAPTDPCPEGYQLIDGKCTPIAEAATGTGFQVFPANRNPSYRTGPFSPSTVATGAGGIRGLNPITFNPFNK